MESSRISKSYQPFRSGLPLITSARAPLDPFSSLSHACQSFFRDYAGGLAFSDLLEVSGWKTQPITRANVMKHWFRHSLSGLFRFAPRSSCSTNALWPLWFSRLTSLSSASESAGNCLCFLSASCNLVLLLCCVFYYCFLIACLNSQNS